MVKAVKLLLSLVFKKFHNIIKYVVNIKRPNLELLLSLSWISVPHEGTHGNKQKHYIYWGLRPTQIISTSKLQHFKCSKQACLWLVLLLLSVRACRVTRSCSCAPTWRFRRAPCLRMIQRVPSLACGVGGRWVGNTPRKFQPSSQRKTH